MSAQHFSRSLLDAFAVAASELGMFSAACVFVEEIAKEGGAPLVAELRDVVGPSYPVLDVVASRFLRRGALPAPDAAGLRASLRGLARVVVVGTEACLIDAVVDHADPTAKIAVVLDTTLVPANEARVAANFEGRAVLCRVEDIVHWCGARSGIVTCVYGSDGHRAAVCGSWFRMMGADTRSWFGAFVGWKVLGPAMQAYPRWLRETVVEEFTELIEPLDVEDPRA